MEKTAGGVLKAEEVKLQGQYHFDVGGASQDAGGVSKPVSGGPQVRIVENNGEYAVMEITCACGTKTQVRCDYK